MYYKVTDSKNNVFIFTIIKDKEIRYSQHRRDCWRIANITSGTILIPTFDSSQAAIDFLMSCRSWEVTEIDIHFTFI